MPKKRARGALAIIISAVLLVASIGPALALWPKDGARVAIVFAPWIDRENAALRVWNAGGRIVAQSEWSVIAEADGPGFHDRLNANGAWVLLDARAVAALCGEREPAWAQSSARRSNGSM